MASSFHWPDFDAAVREFHRLLKPGGYFMALWNTRYYESNPLLVEIEAHLHELAPDMQRVSSGRSAFCNQLTERLSACREFDEVIYLEGRHIEHQSPQRYLACGSPSMTCACSLAKNDSPPFSTISGRRRRLSMISKLNT